MSTFFVYNSNYAGKCYWTEKRSRVSSIFSYDEDYLLKTNNWNIDPSLSLVAGAQASKSGLPGAFRDATPDRWGQMLIRHRHLQECKKRGSTPRTINEVDYLMGVSDASRQGDLRFSLEKDGVFQHPSDDIPKLISLPKLLNATNLYINSMDESAISYLLEAGSASLGGARPKATVCDGSDLYIAKFPHRQDEWDVISWEWVCLNIAAEAGVSVPGNRLIDVDGKNVLLVKRFDRLEENRISYISAMTLLGLTDGDHADYSEIVNELRSISSTVKRDLLELYRRIIISLLINNTDDHLRNHGFLRSGSGWCLSPIFDVNPNPDASAVRATSVFGETEKNAALSALTENAHVFDLTEQSAENIMTEVKSALASCEKFAKKAGIDKSEYNRMLNALTR